MLYSELLGSVAETFMIPDSCVSASQFKLFITNKANTVLQTYSL